MPARGRHPHNKLTALTMRQLGPGRHADGDGLYLFVRETGACQWVQRITIQGRRRDLGLGPFPRVSLAEARRIALENRRIARTGGNPKAEAARKKGPTLREVYEVVTEVRRTNWRRATTEASWRPLFQNDVFPVIPDDTPIAAVTLEDIRRVVVPHWNGRNSKGYIIRQNLEYLLDWAVAQQYRVDNPAAAIKRLLPNRRRPPTHRASLPYREAPDALAVWQSLPVDEGIRLAVLFIVLTASRLGEVTGATWSEIDFSTRVWRVPPDRMKAHLEHKVPLSSQAVAVLERARALKPHPSLVFSLRGRAGDTRRVSQEAVSDALRKLGRLDPDGRPIVAHGFRATFRVWAIEVLQARREVCEKALAHTESDGTVAAYADRAELLDKRVPLMQQWADYVLPSFDGARGKR